MKRKQTVQGCCADQIVAGLPWHIVYLLLLLISTSLNAQPSAALYKTLDLSAYYTSSFSNALPPAVSFPQGSQRFGGVPFKIDGKIELTGTDAARHGEFHPTQIIGIPVNQKANGLELLHGTRHGLKDGTPLANLVWHFKNGAARTNRLAFGVHARNYLEEAGARVKDLADPNSLVVWELETRGTNDTTARFYKSTLENPLPSEEIASIDLVSLFSRATPVIFAITVQTSGTASPLQIAPRRKIIQRATQFEDSIYRATVEVRVKEASTGKAVTNAVAMLTIKDDSKSFFFGQYTTDMSGRLSLAYPPQQAVSLSLRVSSPGFVPGTALLSIHDAQKWPAVMELSLNHGTPIGGLVVDAKGAPVSDATVIPFEVTKTGEKEYTRTDLDVVKTGSDGRWLATAVNEALPTMSFEVLHPEYHAATYEHQLATQDLIKRSATMSLVAHLRIAGKVVYSTGLPVPNATVILDYGGDNHETRVADAGGKFSFVVRNPTNSSASIIALGTNYAPAYRSVPLREGPPVEIALDGGSTYKMRITDQSRAPIPGVKVTLDRWQNSRALQFRTQTDSDGRFTWEHAPAGLITWRYEKTGYSVHTHSMTLPISGETSFIYPRQTRLYGRVVDADTKKPLDQFSYASRYRYLNNQPKRWNRYSTGTGNKGRFSTYFGSISDAEWSLVIEARGYQPLVSDTITNSGSFSNVFELKKGKPFVGVVTTPDGVPVAKAEVVLLDTSTYASMDEKGKFRRSSYNHETVVTTQTGHFELTPRPEPDLVIAAHPKLGFAQVPAAEVQKTGKIVLQPWGHVKGVLRIGDKVEPYHYVALHTRYDQADLGGRSQVPFYMYFQAKPNDDGSFSFDAVPPGNRVAYLLYQFEQKSSGTMKLSHNVPLLVKPGETNEIVIGGTGRTVIGKVEATSRSGVQVDWRRDAHTMHWQAPPMGVPQPLSFPANATPAERKKLIEERNASLQKFYRERAAQTNMEQHSYVLLFEEDGSFRVPNVPPGSYTIQISPTDPRQPNSYRQIGNLNTQVTVPEGKGPHNVGTLNLTLTQ